MGLAMLDVENLTCGYGSRTIVRDASLAISAGEIMCLLGPNGSGKTTFFKTILGFLKPLGGRMRMEGEDIACMKRTRLARSVAYVPQSHAPSFPFRVSEVVTMGRTAHLGLFASPSRRDVEVARESLDTVGIGYLADKPYTEISGGERQMTLIARALAQQAKLLIMDEPTSSLDFGNQVRVLGHIRKLTARGIGILFTTHIPGHALLCADRVAVMHGGTIRRTGTPHDIVTETCLRELYGVEARVIDWTDKDGARFGACVPMLS
jgi:iron complex transport system ATP-binding protein